MTQVRTPKRKRRLIWASSTGHYSLWRGERFKFGVKGHNVSEWEWKVARYTYVYVGFYRLEVRG
jgi:hypothetical protein